MLIFMLMDSYVLTLTLFLYVCVLVFILVTRRHDKMTILIKQHDMPHAYVLKVIKYFTRNKKRTFK